MRNLFQEYTTSTAFSLSLSALQTRILLAYEAGDKYYCLDKLHFGTLRALERKGLLEWQGCEDKKTGPFITEAGQGVATLLKIAGFKHKGDS